MNLDRYEIALVQPKAAGNLGATARVIRNMGIGRLRVVRPRFELGLEALQGATHGRDVLANMHLELGDTDAWIDEADVIVATSRHCGRRRTAILGVREMARLAADLPAGTRVTMLFGAEDRGLPQSLLSKADWLVSIGTDETAGSMNLSHAVGIVAHELRMAESDAAARTKSEGGDARGRREAMTRTLVDALERTDALRGGDPERLRLQIRRLIERLDPDPGTWALIEGLVERACEGRGRVP